MKVARLHGAKDIRLEDVVLYPYSDVAYSLSIIISFNGSSEVTHRM